jgi:hypothetical protein
MLTSMEEGRSQRHKDLLLPRLLARPMVHHLRSSWRGVDRELEGYLVMRIPFRRKICASGTYRGRPTFIFAVMIRTSRNFLSTQWLPQSQIVRPDFPPRKAMEVSTRDGLWSLWRRNVSTHPIHIHIPIPLSLFFFLSPSFFSLPSAV